MENQNYTVIDSVEALEKALKEQREAQKKFAAYTQEQVDVLCREIAKTVYDNAEMLAKMAVEETGRGIYEDKITKNMFATEYVYHSIKYDKTVHAPSLLEESDKIDIINSALMGIVFSS